MRKLKKDLILSSFSHIYVEKEAIKHAAAEEVLKKLKKAIHIEIDHYKDVFCRRGQSFWVQKCSRKLILAVKEDNFIYSGSDMCQDFGNEFFYYTGNVMNCIYDCEYCYLQGMYPSANIVVFVNIEDYFKQVERLLLKHPVYLCISYDTDILALENLFHFTSKWIEFARGKSELKIEVRTKSANFKAIQEIKPPENVILAWTLSPKKVIKEVEKGTPSLEARLQNINDAIDKGWNVRLCFDPLLYINEWEKEYTLLIKKVFNKINPYKIMDVSVGMFRIPADYMKKIRKDGCIPSIIAYPFENHEGTYTYPKHIASKICDTMISQLEKYIPRDKIYAFL